jgi:hypothetical protein
VFSTFVHLFLLLLLLLCDFFLWCSYNCLVCLFCSPFNSSLPPSPCSALPFLFPLPIPLFAPAAQCAQRAEQLDDAQLSAARMQLPAARRALCSRLLRSAQNSWAMCAAESYAMCSSLLHVAQWSCALRMGLASLGQPRIRPMTGPGKKKEPRPKRLAQ